MNASKFLVSTAAAIAVVGAAGFAYAQSTSPATGAPADPQSQNATPMTNGAMPANPNTPNQGRTNADGSMMNGGVNNGSTGTLNRASDETKNAQSAGTMNRSSTSGTRGMNNANGTNSNDSSGNMGTAPDDNSNSSAERPARAARN